MLASMGNHLQDGLPTQLDTPLATPMVRSLGLRRP